MAVTSTALAIVGAIGSVASTIVNSQSTSASAQYQADIAEQNAKIAQEQANMAILEGNEAKKEGYEDMLRKKQETAQIVSNQRALQGASGSVLDVGSNLDLNLDTVEKGTLDALSLKEQGEWADYNKRVEAWNYQNQANSQNAQSEFMTNRANSATNYLNVGNSIISSASKVGSNYFKLK